MGEESKISWTDATWNPATGCSKKVLEVLLSDIINKEGIIYPFIEYKPSEKDILLYEPDFNGIILTEENQNKKIKILDPACLNCYMFPLAERLKEQAKGRYDKMVLEHKLTQDEADNRFKKAKYYNGSKFRIHWNDVDWPLTIKKSNMIFVNSMSDLFHEQMPLDFLQNVFKTMNTAYWHQFQVLTKRSQIALDLANHFTWSDNIWLGVSVGTHLSYHYIDDLLQTPAKIKFLSLAPLLEELHLKPYLEKITDPEHFWIIVEGESPQPTARPLNLDWVRKIRDDCETYNIPFHFKQKGGTNKPCSCCGAKGCRVLDNKIHDAFPKFNFRTYEQKQSLLNFT